MEQSDKTFETKYVCGECGLVHVKTESVDSNKADQKKLIMLAVGGIIALLLLWFGVFKWLVPLVRHISGLE